MIERKYGRIVNIASVAGKEGNPNASHYSASKAGLIALTKSLGKELAGKGVLVNAVTPAAAKTAMFATDDAAAHRLHALEDPDGRASSRSAKRRRWSPGSPRRTARSAPASVFDLSGGRARPLLTRRAGLQSGHAGAVTEPPPPRRPAAASPRALGAARCSSPPPGCSARSPKTSSPATALTVLDAAGRRVAAPPRDARADARDARRHRPAFDVRRRLLHRDAVALSSPSSGAGGS